MIDAISLPVDNPFIRALDGLRETPNGWQAICPAHDDRTASLSVGKGDDGKLLIHCFAGCTPQSVVAAVGLQMSDLMPRRNGRASKKSFGKIVAEYDYRDEAGELLYQAVRFHPKDFRQRVPDGNGGWTWKTKGVRRVLYRLPELLAADPSETVYIVEGEKDVDTLRKRGCVATCNVGGASKWQKEYNEHLRGRSVVILPDNDDAGRKHARMVAKSLVGVAASVKIVELPKLPEHGDVSDWLTAGGTVEAIEAIAAAAPEAVKQSATNNPRPNRAAAKQTGLPEVPLPGGEITITSAAAMFGELLGATGQFYLRGGVPMRLVRADGEPALQVMRAPALCSDLETVARLVRVQQTKDDETAAPATCSESAARLLLESNALRSALPPITVVSRCPVLIERDGQLVPVASYDRGSGVLASGSEPTAMDLPDALALLSELVDGFKFATPGDRARALAATITPALVFGGLLGGRAPIDLGEATDSQAGKGYRNRLTGAIYRTTPRMVTQRATCGVGSIQESFDAVLVSGSCIISFDNFRGKLDLPGLESFLTEDSYLARIPYAAPVAIDPRRIIVQITSNQAQVTSDLANRCSCVRILKHPDGHEFKQYGGGDLLDHVADNQADYLGAVFAVVREWHRLGKPQLARADHDFRRWAKVLGYIVENIMGAGGLLVGHRAAQQRIASPGLSWLRDVALAVLKAKQGELWLRTHNLLTIVVEAGIDTPGIDPAAIDDDDAWRKATQTLGRKLGKVFASRESIEIDSMGIERREGTDDQWRRKTEFAFFPATPNNPQ